MRITTVSLAAVGLLALTRSNGNAQQVPTLSEVRAKILSVGSAIDTAFRRGDAEGAAAYFTDDAVMSPAEQSDVNGRAGVRAFFANFLAGNAVSYFTTQPTAIEVCDSLAYERGTFAWAFVPRGQPSVMLRGRYSTMWVRGGDGIWRIHRYLENLIPNSAPPR